MSARSAIMLPITRQALLIKTLKTNPHYQLMINSHNPIMSN